MLITSVLNVIETFIAIKRTALQMLMIQCNKHMIQNIIFYMFLEVLGLKPVKNTNLFKDLVLVLLYNH